MKLVYDLETTSLDVHSCEILGVAICIEVGTAYYITFPEDEKGILKILKVLRPYFEDDTIEKVGHNLKFDNQVLKQYGINVKGKLHDTMVTDYILYPERKKHGLKLLSKLHLNYKQIEFNSIALGKSKEKKTLEGIDPKLITEYACEDVDQTLQIFNFLYPKIESYKLEKIYTLDNRLVEVLTAMEYNGVTIDSQKLLKVESEIESRLVGILESIGKFTGANININSTKQLNKLLFDELYIEPIGSKNKNGNYSVSKNVLKKLETKHEIVKMILDYRSLYKVKSTFIKALKKVNPKTKKLHTSINQTRTETGRLSSSNPNLQNIPSKTIGSKLRECFTASSDQHSLIGVDYSNIELRVMAIISRDEKMIKAYREGIDLHKLTASKVLEIPYEDVSDSQRDMAKAINFGLIYGMTSLGLSESLTNTTGSEYTVEQCQNFINQYFELYQGVAKCKEELIYKATINGYTETLFGRKRSLLNINSNDSYKRESAKRLAMNTPIQGTAADIIKIAMVNIHDRIQKEELQSKMILQVHDELLFDVPKNEVVYMEKVIKHEMENAVHLPVALIADLKTGKTWADVH